MSEPCPGRSFDGKKFLWDGKQYDDRGQAQQAADTYRAELFEVRLAEHEGKFLVYTRRVVTQSAATAP